MSLQLAAQHLASKGRGKDSRLVHMTPNELKGLQALAKAKGGSLTINPETGLPEAGFLEDVLPIAATAATMFFAPQLAPTIGSSLFGAASGSALATGLGAGLMAGGYNLLGQALGGQGINVGKALTSGAITGLGAGALQGLGAYTPTSDVVTQTAATAKAPVVPAQIIGPGAELTPVSQSLVSVDPTLTSPPGGYFTNAQGRLLSEIPTETGGVFQDASGKLYSQTGELINTNLPASQLPPTIKSAGTGLTGNQKLALGLGGAGALSLLGSMGQKKIPTQPASPSYIRPYTYTSTATTPTGTYPSPYATTQYDEAGNPIIDTRERDYFTQTYTALPPYQAAGGGLMMANGGPVERMTAMNTSINPQGGLYPQGMIDKTQYATPSQRPASMEIIENEPAYQRSNPLIGAAGMAEGGIAEEANISDFIKSQILANATGSAPAFTYDPAKQMYSQGLPAINQSAMPGGFDPLVVQAYQAQNPNQFRYDAANQRYLSPMPTQDQYSAYLADLRAQQAAAAQQAAPAPSGDSGGGGKAGGLMPYNLGSYSDGGRLLKGPGDGMSDNIPATIGKKQPARLADGEFVVPADVVSHLGNGSTDAGAKRLYAMMDKVRKARTGTKKQGKQIKAEKYIPA